jgi:hypothetical protein
MKRRTAHRAIAESYQTALGDAIELPRDRVAAGTTSLDQLWPLDGVHPGDAGYALFADAAWSAFQAAVAAKQVCRPPEKMLYNETYMTSDRGHLAQLKDLPSGWQPTAPQVTSAYFDMMMSRWLDDEVVVRSPLKDRKQNEPAEKATTPAEDGAGPAGDEAAPPERLSTSFRGSMVMLFGESTPKSVRYRVWIDGKLVEHREGGANSPLLEEFDAGKFGRRAGGNVHHVQVIATGLDPLKPHTFELEPIFDAPGQELRLESLCTAGAPAGE